jgi:HK97 family phage major capsid protein
MKHIIEMREKRANLLSQARELHQRSVDEKRDMSADENTQYDKIMGEMDGLKAKIDREERLAAETKEMESRTDKAIGGAGTPGEQRGGSDEEKATAEKRSAFREYLMGGIDGVSDERRSYAQEARALAAGSGTAGGYTVPQGFYAELQEAMKAFGGMRNVAFNLNTAAGNQLMIPTANNVSQVGAILAENAAATTSDPSFGQTSLTAYKYTSNIILVPIELLQDSAFDVESWVRSKIAERIARITNQHFTTGTGTGQPTGIVTGAVSGKVGTTGQTTSIIADDLVDLEHAIDPAYRAGSTFMMHDQSLKVIKKLKDTQGRFLWMPGLTSNAPDTILGYKYEINQDMATMAANAKSVLFGRLSSYWIRNVMDISLVRFGEKYMDAGQVGFVAFARYDGKFINAGGNEIAYYANSAT